MDRFLTFMKLKPRFYKDLNAPHCPTVTVNYHLCQAPSQLRVACVVRNAWEREQAFLSIGMYTVSSVQATTKGCSKQLGLAVTVTVPANSRTGS